MRPELQHQLIERVLAHVEHRTTDTEDRPTLLPTAAYYAGADREARFAREQTALFRELPVLAGHVSQIPNPGDFFTHDASGVPLLIARDDAGQVGAFLNLCRHRGTRVEPAGAARRKRSSARITRGATAATARCSACRTSAGSCRSCARTAASFAFRAMSPPA